MAEECMAEEAWPPPAAAGSGASRSNGRSSDASGRERGMASLLRRHPKHKVNAAVGRPFRGAGRRRLLRRALGLPDPDEEVGVERDAVMRVLECHGHLALLRIDHRPLPQLERALAHYHGEPALIGML